MNRLKHLDGLRGIAIIMVVLFHAFSRWKTIEPWPTNEFLDSLLGMAWLGVELFFVISGFVIFLSLEKTAKLSTFIYKRWLRLFPAMFVSSLFILGFSYFTPDRPNGDAPLLDFLPGILFIDPKLISALFGIEISSLDGVFWSLYVEVQFYLIIAFSYFFLKDNRGYLILLIFPMYLGLKILKSLTGGHPVLNEIILWTKYLNFGYYGWFACGICYYHFYAKRGQFYLFASIGFAFISSFQIARTYTDFQLSIAIHAFCLISLYWFSFHSQWFAKQMSHKFWGFFGFISYPLYLVHQNIVTGLGIEMYKLVPGLPGFIYPILPLGIVVGISYGISKAEPFMRKHIERLFQRS